ncbi:MAG: glycine/betaine/sarcosine/D-proline family reductase selenoprotein B [Deltaproteobacteria bacterium]|nr:glycine/betaine/sarcosine/D-proline family reductase selenoprotein B [Deltaproteobacteria bacterium]
MISKELDRAGIPTAVISAMYPVVEQVGASRIVRGVRIPHPCGDPTLSAELDGRLRRGIVETALKALVSEVQGPTLFVPKMAVAA